MNCCAGATLNTVFEVIRKYRRFHKWQEVLVDNASPVNLTCIMAELDDLRNALNTLPNRTLSEASQVRNFAFWVLLSLHSSAVDLLRGAHIIAIAPARADN